MAMEMAAAGGTVVAAAAVVAGNRAAAMEMATVVEAQLEWVAKAVEAAVTARVVAVVAMGAACPAAAS